jgi:hypothetical protein
MFGLQQIKKKILMAKLKRAELSVSSQYMNFRPSRQLPISVRREGSRWLCVFECDDDPLKCVAAYGESPEQATMNFDYLWNGAPGFVIEDEPDEEEQF